ncbi:hypothetical protein [Fictibacillus phosphorivorans]|uniref:hypothetical protein n=1 Tax=Fictibacillus phosphorivorans TaxID=1221500 RepID=UPI0011A12440|nr:hypothetical protein [Fictibacillus phosphorivorans]
MFPTNKKDFIKALNFGLLLYAILGAVSGTLMFASILFVNSPENELQREIGTLSIVAIFVYGSCVIALIIRSILKKRGWI